MEEGKAPGLSWKRVEDTLSVAPPFPRALQGSGGNTSRPLDEWPARTGTAVSLRSLPAAPRPLPCPRRRSAMAKAGKAPMAADEGYCVKCKAKRKISNPQQVKMANGRPALKGVCPVCGTGMFKILPPK